MRPRSSNGISTSGDDRHPVLVISHKNWGAADSNQRVQGHEGTKMRQPLRLRRQSTMLAGCLLGIGFLFLAILNVTFMGHRTVFRGFRPGESRVDVSGLPSTVVIEDDTKRLAVVVPTSNVDLPRALNSLVYWPTTCYETTLQKTDLVLYYAGGPEDKVADRFLSKLAQTGGRCFAKTRIVLGNLTDEVSLSMFGLNNTDYYTQPQKFKNT